MIFRFALVVFSHVNVVLAPTLSTKSLSTTTIVYKILSVCEYTHVNILFGTTLVEHVISRHSSNNNDHVIQFYNAL